MGSVKFHALVVLLVLALGAALLIELLRCTNNALIFFIFFIRVNPNIL